MREVEPPAEPSVAPVWAVEVAVAAALTLVGVVVVSDSLRAGAGWAAEGPEAGFFPFYVGLILVAAAGWILIGNLAPARRDRAGFAERASLMRVLALLVPAAVFVAAAPWLGLYLASAALIAGFMRVLGGFGLAQALATGIAIALVLFVTFELWFVMPLPKGPLEEALGF